MDFSLLYSDDHPQPLTASVGGFAGAVGNQIHRSYSTGSVTSNAGSSYIGGIDMGGFAAADVDPVAGKDTYVALGA